LVLTDNVLVFIAGACHPNVGGNRFTPMGMRDINGNIFRMLIYSGINSNNLNVSAVAKTGQIGKGLTPPTRQDQNIENPFTNGGGAPEDTPQNSINASYNNGSEKIEMVTTIIAGGNGSITEVCKFTTVNDGDTGQDRIVMLTRDLLPVPVAFISGQTINILHEVST